MLRERTLHPALIGAGEDVCARAGGQLREEYLAAVEIEAHGDARMRPLEGRTDVAERAVQRRGGEDDERPNRENHLGLLLASRRDALCAAHKKARVLLAPGGDLRAHYSDCRSRKYGGGATCMLRR